MMQLSFVKLLCFLWMMKCLELKAESTTDLDLILIQWQHEIHAPASPVPLAAYKTCIWTQNAWHRNKIWVQQRSGKTDNHLMHFERPAGGWVWTRGLRYKENIKSQSMSLETSQPNICLVQLPSWMIIFREGEDTRKAWQKDWLIFDSFLQKSSHLFLLYSGHPCLGWFECLATVEKWQQSWACSLFIFYPRTTFMRSLQDIKGFHSLLMLMLTIQSFHLKPHLLVLIKSADPREKSMSHYYFYYFFVCDHVLFMKQTGLIGSKRKHNLSIQW